LKEASSSQQAPKIEKKKPGKSNESRASRNVNEVQQAEEPVTALRKFTNKQ
jgi:hypothetical protein